MFRNMVLEVFKVIDCFGLVCVDFFVIEDN